MPRPSEWRFASYRLVVPAADQPDSYFANALRQTGYLRSGNFEWGFTNVDEVTHEAERFLFGYLYKNKPLSERSRIDRTEHRIRSEPMEDELIAKSAFFVLPRLHLMALHPQGTLITVRTFAKTFGGLVEQLSRIGFVTFSMSEIGSVEGILESIQSYASIEKLSIRLTLPNPRLNPTWGGVKDDIVEAGAFEYLQTFSPGKGKSLTITPGSRARRSIEMAADGYGQATLVGHDANGERRLASTHEFPMTAEAPSIESSSKEYVLGVLIKRFREIIDRGEADDHARRT